jgi:hypothetical protein
MIRETRREIKEKAAIAGRPNAAAGVMTRVAVSAKSARLQAPSQGDR